MACFMACHDDVLHRQIIYSREQRDTDSFSGKKWLTLREGSRRCSALHGTHSACACATDRSPPVPVEGPVQKAFTFEE